MGSVSQEAMLAGLVETKKHVTVTSPYDVKSIFGPQGQRLIPTVRHDMCGTTNLSACFVYMPPGRVARVHVHNHTDIAVVVIEGYVASLIGEHMDPVLHGPGEFVFIPEGVSHAAVNLSTTDRLIAIEMRTDPNFNEDVEVQPMFEDRAREVAKTLQEQFATGDIQRAMGWHVVPGEPFRFADITEDQIL